MDIDQPAPRAAGATDRPIPRSRLAIGLGPTLRPRLDELARGRTLVIDWFAARCCQGRYAIGDLTTRWLDGPVTEPLVPLAPVARVALAADRRLLGVLGSAGPTLRLGGPPFARHPVVELQRPELWLDFLATPAGQRRRG